MALGGGIWTTQNKVLPGTYVNFTSAIKATAELSERGYAAVPLNLDWGADGTIFTVTNEDFNTNCLKIFGYNSYDPEMLPLREIFCYTKTLYTYRLNSGGTKASNTYATAKYAGTAGNKLGIVIAANADESSKFDVSTYYDTTLVDMQTVATAAELVDNDFVVFKKEGSLSATAKTPLTSGTNGTVETADYQAFLDKLESYSFNTLGCPTADSTVVKLFINYTKRLRDEIGAKFQTVIYNPFASDKVADYEGVIEVANAVTGSDAYALVYWVTGASAGCAVNKSNTNKIYNGELTVNVDFTQAQLAQGITDGRFMFHNVNGDIRVLEDVDSLTTTSADKGDIFKANQTIRVIDQIANDTAVLFNTRYLGIVPNDADGRTALWNDICKLYQELEAIRAIEDFNPDTVKIAQGESKKAVVCTVEALNIVNAMSQLYLSVVIQ